MDTFYEYRQAHVLRFNKLNPCLMVLMLESVFAGFVVQQFFGVNILNLVSTFLLMYCSFLIFYVFLVADSNCTLNYSNLKKGFFFLVFLIDGKCISC